MFRSVSGVATASVTGSRVAVGVVEQAASSAAASSAAASSAAAQGVNPRQPAAPGWRGLCIDIGPPGQVGVEPSRSFCPERCSRDASPARDVRRALTAVKRDAVARRRMRR